MTARRPWRTGTRPDMPASLRVPRGFREPLTAARVLHQVVERRVLDPAKRAVGAAHRAADAFAVRVADRRRTGERVEHGRTPGPGPAAAGIVRVGANRPVAVAKPDRAAARQAERTRDVAAAASEGPSAEQADLAVAVRTVDHAVPALEGQAVEVASRDHVHHAGDRVGAVRRGAAVTQELDLLDRDHGKRVRVDDELGLVRDRARRPGKPVAVQQHKGPARPQAAQVEGRAVRTGAGTELIGFQVRAEAEREVPDHAEHRGRAFRLQVLASEDRDRLCGILGRSRNPGAGHGHRVAEGLDLVGVVLVRVAGIVRRVVPVFLNRSLLRLLGHPRRRGEEARQSERRGVPQPLEPGQLTTRLGFMPEQPSCFAAVEQRPV